VKILDNKQPSWLDKFLVWLDSGPINREAKISFGVIFSLPFIGLVMAVNTLAVTEDTLVVTEEEKLGVTITMFVLLFLMVGANILEFTDYKKLTPSMIAYNGLYIVCIGLCLAAGYISPWVELLTIPIVVFMLVINIVKNVER
jgi:hypothetical protein